MLPSYVYLAAYFFHIHGIINPKHGQYIPKHGQQVVYTIT